MATSSSVMEIKVSKEATKTVNVSGHGNSCGLFALVLGIQLAVEAHPAMKKNLNEKILALLKISTPLLTGTDKNIPEQQSVGEIDKLLRTKLYEALQNHPSFIEERLFNFMGWCATVLTRKEIKDMSREEKKDARELDEYSLLLANKNLVDDLKKLWLSKQSILNKNYEKIKKEFLDIINNEIKAISEEQLSDLRKELFALEKEPSDKVASEFIDKLFFQLGKEAPTIKVLIRLQLLQMKARFPIKLSDKLSEKIQNALRKKIIDEFMKMNKNNQDNENERIRKLLLLAFSESMNFKNDPKVPTLVQYAVNLNMAALFSEWFCYDKKQAIYEKYCKHIQDNHPMLTADELGILAKDWNIQLKIQFPHATEILPPYQSYPEYDFLKLHVLLSNRSRTHWQVEAHNSSLSLEQSPSPETPKKKTVAADSGVSASKNTDKSTGTAISPVKISDVVQVISGSKEPETYIMSHLLAAGFRGSEYQILVLLLRITQLLLDTEKTFSAQLEADGFGNLDDISLLIKNKGKKDPKEKNLETYQVKYYVSPLSIYDFYEKDLKSLDVDSEEPEDDTTEESCKTDESNKKESNKTQKMHIGKFLDGWLNWCAQYPEVPNENRTSIVYSNAALDDVLSKCVSAEGKLKEEFISEKEKISFSKTKTAKMRVPQNFLTKPPHKLSTGNSKTIWVALINAGILDDNGHFTDKFPPESNKLTLKKTCLPVGMSNQKVLVRLQELYQQHLDDHLDLYTVLYKEAWHYLGKKRKHEKITGKIESDKKKLFNNFLRSFHFRVNQPKIDALELEIQNNLMKYLNEPPQQMFLCLYYNLRDWFRREYPDKKVPILTKKIIKKLFEESKTRNVDVILFQGRSQATISRIASLKAKKLIERKETAEFTKAIQQDKVSLLMVSGDKGIGKSTLVQQCLTECHSAEYLFLSASDFVDDSELQKKLLAVLEKIEFIRILVIDGAEILHTDAHSKFIHSIFARKKILILTLTSEALQTTFFKKIQDSVPDKASICMQSLESSNVEKVYPQFALHDLSKSFITMVQKPFNLSNILKITEAKELKKPISEFDFSQIIDEVQLIKKAVEGEDPKYVQERRIAWLKFAVKISEECYESNFTVLLSKPEKGVAMLVASKVIEQQGEHYRFVHDLYFEMALMSYWIQKWEQARIENETVHFWTKLAEKLKIRQINNIIGKWFVFYRDQIWEDMVNCSSVIVKATYFKHLFHVAIVSHDNEFLKEFFKNKEIIWENIFDTNVGSYISLTTFVSLAIQHNNSLALQLMLQNGVSCHHPQAGSLMLNYTTASYNKIHDKSNEKADQDSSSNNRDSDDENKTKNDSEASNSESGSDESGYSLRDADEEGSQSFYTPQDIEPESYDEDDNNLVKKFCDDIDKYWNAGFYESTGEVNEEGEWVDNPHSQEPPNHDTYYMHMATLEDNDECLSLLLDKYQELDQAQQMINLNNQYQETPLHLAALKKRDKSLTLLLDRGAYVNATDAWGETPLHNAVYDNNLFAVRTLLERGADPNALSENELSPIHIAVANLALPIVKLLLLYGADLSALPFGTSVSNDQNSDFEVSDLLDKIYQRKEKEDKEEVEEFIIEVIKLLNFGWDTKDFKWGSQCKTINLSLRSVQLAQVEELITLIDHRAQLSENSPDFDYYDEETELEYAIQHHDTDKIENLKDYILSDPENISSVFDSEVFDEKHANIEDEMIDFFFEDVSDEQYKNLRKYAEQYENKKMLKRIKKVDELNENDSESSYSKNVPSQDNDAEQNSEKLDSDSDSTEEEDDNKNSKNLDKKPLLFQFMSGSGTQNNSQGHKTLTEKKKLV